MASDTIANKPHQAFQPQAGMNSGPANRASAVPVGIYAPHTPSMPGSWATGTRRRIKAGAGTAPSKVPKPSMARSASKAVTEVVNAPKPLASASRHKPRTMLRRRPMPSAHKPMNTARLMPASCTMDKRKPDCTSVRPSSACSAGKAGGSLPTCKAATPPARTTIQAARWAGTRLTATCAPSGVRVRAGRSGRSCRQCSRPLCDAHGWQRQSRWAFLQAGPHKRQTTRAPPAAPVRWCA